MFVADPAVGETLQNKVNIRTATTTCNIMIIKCTMDNEKTRTKHNKLIRFMQSHRLSVQPQGHPRSRRLETRSEELIINKIRLF